ncbi:MAG TPA: preprotein translocase subunit SecE [Caulobacteraceae bacterium]|nr:preprotein translocase subunit SecE [Caulobacteraceae bacterium]
MAKDQGAVPTTLRQRTPLRVAPAADAPPKKPFNIVQFGREVRAEARKVTWTTWKETWITSVMVGVMVVAVSLFFFFVDTAFGFGMNQLLKLGGGQ